MNSYNMWSGAGAQPAFSQDPALRPPAAPKLAQQPSTRQRLAKAITDSMVANPTQGGGFWGGMGNAAAKISSAYVNSKMPKQPKKKWTGG